MSHAHRTSSSTRKLPWSALSGALALLAIVPAPAVARGPGGDQTIVALRGRDEPGLRRLMVAQQDPASPDYRRWLTRRDFGRRFGASPRDLHRVEAWLRSVGCRVKRFAGRQQVACVGARPGEVPASLAGLVDGVLDPATPLGLRFNMTVEPEPRSLSPANGIFYFSPQEYAGFYGFDGLHAAGIDGTGQHIGIVGAAGVVPDNIAAFRAFFGLTPLDLEQVPASSAVTAPSAGLDAQLESLLDVSWAGAVAPAASIVLAVSSGALVDSISYLVERPDVSVLSLSVVLIPSPQANPFIRQARRLFRQAAMQGQTVLIASGDFGPLLEITPTRKRGVDPFAASPFVTAVGGTSPTPIDPSSAFTYGSEVVWQDGDAASGGGPSGVARPRWQRGSSSRTVPDVSLAASNVYPLTNPSSGGLFCCVGGTSAAAPAWAGLIAMLNQQRGSAVGFPNPALYTLGRAQAKGGTAVYHDIVMGTTSTSLARGFPAKRGYDLATGWGTPNAAALFAAFPQ